VAADRQLRLLGEIVQTLDEAGVAFWLRGGWALDFLVGRIRDDHADIDLVAWRTEKEAIDEALSGRGFERVGEQANVALEFEKEGESIQVLLVETTPSGTLVVRSFESWPFPEGALGHARRLGDVVCRTLTPRALLYEKETYEANKGRPLREKDHLSIRLLRELSAES
jgi:hypothetical protein